MIRKQISNEFDPKALTIFNKGGVPITSCSAENVLQGGLFSALSHYVQECFETELNQIKFGNQVIIFKRSKHLLGAIIMDNTDKIAANNIEVGLKDLLEHLEANCPEFEKEKFDEQKIENLVEQYITDLS